MVVLCEVIVGDFSFMVGVDWVLEDLFCVVCVLCDLVEILE